MDSCLCFNTIHSSFVFTKEMILRLFLHRNCTLSGAVWLFKNRTNYEI